MLHKYFTLVRNHNMIQLEKLKYVPLNSFFAFDKENYFTNLVNLIYNYLTICK